MKLKRIDFILSGYNADGEPHVVIIEPSNGARCR